MRKKIICIIIACLLFGAIASGYYLYTHEDKITVAIVPLDSRPCNTRYPYLLGQMADMRVILPPAELLQILGGYSYKESYGCLLDIKI